MQVARSLTLPCSSECPAMQPLSTAPAWPTTARAPATAPSKLSIDCGWRPTRPETGQPITGPRLSGRSRLRCSGLCQRHVSVSRVSDPSPYFRVCWNPKPTEPSSLRRSETSTVTRHRPNERLISGTSLPNPRTIRINRVESTLTLENRTRRLPQQPPAPAATRHPAPCRTSAPGATGKLVSTVPPRLEPHLMPPRL
jgi:hypothetical protein